MKGIFKSKPRTSVELVQQVRELLVFVDRNAETREKKREEKVRFFFFVIIIILAP